MASDIEAILQKDNLRQVELEPIVTVSKTATILETIQKIKEEPEVKLAIVVENEKPIGVLTHRGVMLNVALSEKNLNAPIENAMTPISETLTLDSSLQKTLDVLNRKSRRTMPIVDAEGKVLGAITARALINHIVAYYPTTVYNLPPNPQQVSSAADGA